MKEVLKSIAPCSVITSPKIIARAHQKNRYIWHRCCNDLNEYLITLTVCQWIYGLAHLSFSSSLFFILSHNGKFGQFSYSTYIYKLICDIICTYLSISCFGTSIETLLQRNAHNIILSDGLCNNLISALVVWLVTNAT